MAAPKTVLTYPLNGAQKDFIIPFEYLARKFIAVTLIGKTRQTLTLNSDYRFTSRTNVTTTKAWGPGDQFTSIEIRRVTSATDRLVDFADGSILRAYDLNTSQVQSLHIAEEARDLTADTIAVNNDGDLDARGRRLVNLADAVLDGDAVTLRQDKAWGASALNQANRSEQQANIATQQANIAGSQARTAVDAAGTSTVMANESARHSGNSSTSAAQSKESATTSIANSNLSKAWANAAEDVLVTPGLYSSLHYSRKSANSAAQAYQDANRSTTQADRSKTEADRAKVEADKLGNANAFMGTIFDVQGYAVRFRGTHLIKQALYIQRQGTDDISDFVSWSYEPNGAVYQRSRYGVPFTSLDPSGNFAVSGTITANSGSFFSVSPADSGNAHLWFDGPSGNRGVIYAGIDQVIRLRAGRTTVGMTVEPNGKVNTATDLIVGGSIGLPQATIPPNADIRAEWMTGGSLYGALSRVTPGTRLRNTPSVIWERGVDTVGGVGDQGATGSQFYLREPLQSGDFYMFEIYGGGKFYSTTNCIPFGESATEEHNVQFDSGGAMLFTLTEGGRRITVKAGKPNNQYGIRRVFIFKLTIA
ncbi:tail fiber protein [Pseudomonas phage vB_PaeM-G11]|uniref:Tail fiber protein n=1 Tax=Pseudomonas phage vB_PaeM-G11 TaxID=3034915 RepID=A0AAF0I8T3_9CAUD|nr:phage tail fiber protein [Pseudomonas sp. D3]WEM05632.1 tail fiber protein [Pseudomonas phage vB_PaeM-G11]WET13058.1 phage tail fiber protein [Pseudomonas sp. D3]